MLPIEDCLVQSITTDDITRLMLAHCDRLGVNYREIIGPENVKRYLAA